ncbi:MAG: hypothetical protein ACUVRH_05085 [Candidatus Bipolaricaulia bacterium]
MARLIWLEVKALLRQPVWIFLAAWAALVLTHAPTFLGVEPSFFTPSLELEPRAGPLPTMFSIWGHDCFSVGEWGRAVLYGVGSLLPSGVVFHILIGLLTMGLFFSEIVHREVLWATTGARGVHSAWAKLLAVSFVASFAVFLGAGGTLLRVGASEAFVPAGGRFVLVYLVLSWLQILLWAAISMFLFYLVRSRWAVLGLIALVEVGGSFLLSRAPLTPGTFGELVARSYMSDYFVNSFAPLGVIPSAFFLRRVIQIGLVLALLGATVWLRGRYPEWERVRGIAPKVLLVLGILLIAGGGGATLREIRSEVAPFTLQQLWESETDLDRPYVWSKDARALAVPGEYTIFRVPPGTPLPLWAEEIAHSKAREIHRYHAGIITSRYWIEYPQGFIGAPQDLVLIYPIGHPYPPELEGLVRSFQRSIIHPLMERAKLWEKKKPKIIVAWPDDFRSIGNVYAIPEGLFVFTLFGFSPQYPLYWLGEVAWALTATSGMDELARCYLTLFLMAGVVDEGELKKALEWLQDEAEGRSLKEREEVLERLRRGEITERVRQSHPAPSGLPLQLMVHVHMKPERARKILGYWQQGEEIGHKHLIHSLLEGSQGYDKD